MNLAKQQDPKSIFRNRKHFHTPTTKCQNQKSGKKIPFATATRKIKYLGINLSKEIRDRYSENYTTLKKQIKENTNKWKHISCSWIGIINIIKMFLPHKASIDSMEPISKY